MLLAINEKLRFTLTVIVGLLCFSCSQKENRKEQTNQKLEYYYVAYDMECCTMVDIKKQPVEYSSHVNDSTYTLTYIYQHTPKHDTVTYILNQAQNFKAQFVSNRQKKPDELFSRVNSSSLLIYGDYSAGRKEYKVYKYASNGASMDGCISHFWVPEFGIILKQNPVWGGFQKLRTNNDSINRQIELLTDIIYQDQEFYRGCQFELPDEGFALEREKMILEKEKQIVQRQKRVLELQKKQQNSK